ncbi:alpha/beta fold hydrolase [Alicyclobacillus mengziensis]|uniref:Alpha/beta hydrolase n=1 Tax=Alicyclobacillus mengziensis TaxID=2931921 RepID=A0A9X7W4C4_9BACL|nr:alpha/beta hydrolase [Alicyclobacillus mengziensis]QSO49388.1 alpha/beta hydrolase [Alicyclobacillus mengziensis]
MQAGDVGFVFIHGAGGTQSKWRSIQSGMRGYRASYVDLPGHGANALEPQASIEAYATGLSDTIQGDVIVVGHSMGGMIGIELAARNQHVKGLALVASHYALPVHDRILSQLKEGSFPESLFYASYRKPVNPQLLEQEKEEISLVPVETTYLDFRACNSYVNGREAIARLNIPILALYGADDRLLPVAAQDNLMQANTLASATSVTEAGHYVMLERPQDVVDALLAFEDRVVRQQCHKWLKP